MNNFETGGPAFPVVGHFWGDRLGGQLDHGMTLRDYFAAKAMQAHMQILSTTSLPDWNAEIARHSYMVADAMMKAREA